MCTDTPVVPLMRGPQGIKPFRKQLSTYKDLPPLVATTTAAIATNKSVQGATFTAAGAAAGAGSQRQRGHNGDREVRQAEGHGWSPAHRHQCMISELSACKQVCTPHHLHQRRHMQAPSGAVLAVHGQPRPACVACSLHMNLPAPSCVYPPHPRSPHTVPIHPPTHPPARPLAQPPHTTQKVFCLLQPTPSPQKTPPPLCMCAPPHRTSWCSTARGTRCPPQ